MYPLQEAEVGEAGSKVVGFEFVKSYSVVTFLGTVTPYAN